MVDTTLFDPTEGLFIGGHWVPSSGGETRFSMDPFRGAPWAVVPEAAPDDVDRAVGAARAAFDEGPWPLLPGRKRGRLLQRLADLVRENADELAHLETRDTGKLLKESSSQIEAVADGFDYFGGWADKLTGHVLPTDKVNFLVYTLREPVGVVAAITVWNSPLLVLEMKTAPALAAGCTVVVKPAEHTPVSTLAFARLVEEAGFPPGVFNVVTGGPAVGSALAGHAGVDRVSFTGSDRTGKLVAQGAAEHLATVGLELGGKSPNIVFADADLDAATDGAVAGIFAAAGQTCIAGSRVLVERGVHDEFVERFVAKAAAIRLGDPMEAATEMGPMAYAEHRDKVLAAVAGATSEGAVVAAGGGRPTQAELADGFFVEPTVFTGVANDMDVAQDEIFGPVACVLPVADEEEAVRLANDTRYGLGAGIWSRDVARAHRVARKVRAGTIWVNAYRTVSYSVPFGGMKQSGYGRENGREAIEEHLQTKAVWVELSGRQRDPFVLG